VERLQDLPQLQDVTSDLQIAKNPRWNVAIDRDRASARA